MPSNDKKYDVARFSKNLMFFIKKEGLSQSALARNIGVTKQEVYNYIKGYSNPSFKKLPFIAESLNISIDDLFVEHHEVVYSLEDK